MDRKEELRLAIQDIRNLVRPLDAIVRLRSSDKHLMAKLSDAIAKLPDPDLLSQAYAEIKAKIERLVSEDAKARSSAFRQIEASFVEERRASNVTVKETQFGWRIGWIELGVQRDRSKARALFNHEEVVGWQEIGSAAELGELVEEAKQALLKAEWDPDDRRTLFESAYDATCRSRKRSGAKDPNVVPLKDFFRYLRLELVRGELSRGAPSKRLKESVELPTSRFLFNLDRYFEHSSFASAKRRLQLQTAGQAEMKRIGSFTTNGLRPASDYRAHTYIRELPTDTA